ncbi:hypothetical protein QF042_002507 [Pedobacter sp. W3I1]|nr:hypothetical protein [Pedobacter sp. W3I1]
MYRDWNNYQLITYFRFYKEKQSAETQVNDYFILSYPILLFSITIINKKINIPTF